MGGGVLLPLERNCNFERWAHGKATKTMRKIEKVIDRNY